MVANYTLILPRSGITIEWREDDTFRLNSTETWSPAAVYVGGDPRKGFDSQLFHQYWPGDSPDPSWWVVITAVSADLAVTATLADGQPVPVHRLGTLIACEWESRPQAITFTVDGHTHTMQPFRPGSLGPAPYGFGAKQDDIAPADVGWVGFTPLPESTPRFPPDEEGSGPGH